MRSTLRDGIAGAGTGAIGGTIYGLIAGNDAVTIAALAALVCCAAALMRIGPLRITWHHTAGARGFWTAECRACLRAGTRSHANGPLRIAICTEADHVRTSH
jgi:hypothetical protein